VQYRSTGVILRVKPVIHAGDRIELEVSQEVSAAASTTTGVSTSPTISTRKIDTKLTLKDGATVLLGGLMSSNQSKNEGGVPLLKDIPGIGQLFRVDGETNDNTELIVLITPYIISDDKDAEAITDAFRSRLGGWARKPPAVNEKQGQLNPLPQKDSTPNIANTIQTAPSGQAAGPPNANQPLTTGATPTAVTKP